MRIGEREVHEWYGMHGNPLPKPDDIVLYADLSFSALMFHFAAENSSAKDVAATHGFDLKTVEMATELGDEHPLAVEYENGSHLAVGKWNPAAIDGWRLVGKYDTEDGPLAFYIRRRT